MNVREDDRPTARDPAGATPPFQFTAAEPAGPDVRLRGDLVADQAGWRRGRSAVAAGCVAAYFMTLATYVVLRVPYVWRRVRRAIQQRQEVLEERQQLAAMASRRRKEPS